MTTTELESELAEASQVIGALMARLERAGETIKGLEATIGNLRHERDRERPEASKNWDAMSARIASLEGVLSELVAMDKEHDRLQEIEESDCAYRAYVKWKTPIWDEARNLLEAKP